MSQPIHLHRGILETGKTGRTSLFSARPREGLNGRHLTSMTIINIHAINHKSLPSTAKGHSSPSSASGIDIQHYARPSCDMKVYDSGWHSLLRLADFLFPSSGRGDHTGFKPRFKPRQPTEGGELPRRSTNQTRLEFVPTSGHSIVKPGFLQTTPWKSFLPG